MLNILYTVIRVITDNKNYKDSRAGEIKPLSTFLTYNEAEAWAKFQMEFLDKEFDYFIAQWDLCSAFYHNIPDKRLKLVK